MKKIFPIVFAVIFVVGGLYFINKKEAVAPVVPPVFCTQDAKQCSDGSYVGRTGPNCEFAECPVSVPTSGKSGVMGTVTLGPTCPVERIPPDPNCAPKPYSTSIDIAKSGSSKIIKTIESDANGDFKTDLSAGVYIIRAKGGAVLPYCQEISVEVKAGGYSSANISCDTGIR